MPLVGDYAIALVKDSPFVIALAGLAPFLIRIWHSRGRAFNSVYFAVAFFLDLVFVGAMRNNGLAVVAVLLVVIFVISGKFRFRAVTVTLLALVVACLPSQVSKHYVGEHKYVESVSMPLQMIGYGQWAHRDCIPVSTQRYFARIMPPQKWADVYWAQSVDATKDSPDFDKKFLQETKKDFPRHFLNYVKSCPAAAAKGYLIHTRTYWSPLTLPLGKTEQSLFTSLVSNKSGATAAIVARLKDQGVANHSLLPKTLDAPVQAWFSIGTKYLPGPGTWMWLLLGILVGFFYRSCVAEGVLVVLPAVLIYLTLLVASPVAFPFRYVAFLAFYAPFAAAVLTIRPSCQAVAESKIKDRLLSE